MNNTKYKQTEIGEIPADWKVSTFAGTASITMGQSPKGSTVNQDSIGVPLLNGPTEFGDSYPIPIQYTTDPKKIARKNDLLFCVRGSTTGRMNWANQEYAIGRGLASISSKDGGEYQPYVKGLVDYLLPTILAGITGSTFPNVSKTQIESLPVPLPPKPERSEIASILSSIDGKIELNRRMNKTLEEIGKTLFKHWFVDFEFPDENGKPYKSSGGEMVEDELGEVPQGWKTKDLGEIFKINTKSINPSKHPDQVFWHFSIPSYDQYGSPTLEAGITIKSNKTQIQDRTILVSKLNPKQEIRIWSIYSDSWGGNAISSTEFINFVPDGKDWTFANFLFRNDDFYNRFADMSTGSTGSRQRVRPTEAKKLNFVYPSEHARLLFNSVIEPVLVEIDKNVRETMVLKELRDSLLPRLISGKLRVN